ncbi:MAG: NERD domain-containing protein [Methanotrichaceae archaeon]|nr:NERD domain-containing protein [Methanotrichaceae archaeon]
MYAKVGDEMIILSESGDYLKNKGGSGVGGWVLRIFSKQARHHHKGKFGEDLVVDALMNLDDAHYMVNDIVIPPSKGNIDHMIVSPNGIFAIETKNWKGEYVCQGDDWSEHRRRGLTSKDYIVKSPSKQIKRNAYNLSQIIEEDFYNNRFKAWVNPIVVFTDPSVNLKLYDPTVQILRLDELVNHILSTKSYNELPSSEIESLANFIASLRN